LTFLADPQAATAAEAARILGVSRGRVLELAASATDFPPAQSTATGGRVWPRAVMEAWAAAHPDRGPRHTGLEVPTEGVVPPAPSPLAEPPPEPEVDPTAGLELAPTPDGADPRRRKPWGSKVFVDADGNAVRQGPALRQYLIDRNGNPVLTQPSLARSGPSRTPRGFRLVGTGKHQVARSQDGRWPRRQGMPRPQCWRERR
jgi:hypothetical protein